MARLPTIVAVVLIIFGVVAMAGPTFGFSTIAGDRAVNIAVADENAYLEAEEAYNDQRITSGDAQPLIELTNNFAEKVGGDNGEIIVEVSEVSGDIEDNNALQVENVPIELEPGKKGNVEVICADEEINGVNTVDVSLQVTNFSGQFVSVTDKTVDQVTDVEIQCSDTEETQSGLANIRVSDLPYQQGETNQTFEFTLTEDLDQEETIEVSHQVNHVDYSDIRVSIEGDEGNGDVEFTDQHNREFEYEATDGAVSEGATVKIEVEDIDTTDQNAEGEYEVTFERQNGDYDEEVVLFAVDWSNIS